MCDYDDSEAYLEQARKRETFRHIDAEIARERRRDRLFVLLHIFLVLVALAYMAAMGIAIADVVRFLFK